MLVCFSATNYRSIGENVTLDLRANTRLRRLKNHVRKPKLNMTKKRLSLLKSAVIYGANASGKSNLVKAIEAAKTFILEGPRGKHLNRNTFKFSDKNEPTDFYFEFIISRVRIAYMFQIDDERVLYESIMTINDDIETKVFERTYNTEDERYDIETTIDFSGDEESMKIWDEFETLADFCPENKLILTEINSKNEKTLEEKIQQLNTFFKMVDMFFKYRLVIIFPETKYSALGRDILKRKYRDEYVSTLNRFDTGVSDLCINPVNEGRFDKEVIRSLEEQMLETQRDFIMFEYRGGEYYATKDPESGITEYFSVIAKHQDHNGNVKEFDIKEESDGTVRLLDLIPIIESDERDNGTVFVIDEFDRSLHPNLSKSYFNQFIEKTAKNNDQLIVTTHQSELLDNDILRRDEIWFAQKEKDQSTQLYTLDEFNTRSDMDIRYAYLNGKFGAIPFLKNK